jgi:hypothetical protein
MLSSQRLALPHNQGSKSPALAALKRQIGAGCDQGQVPTPDSPTKQLMVRWRQSTAVAVEGIAKLEHELQEARAEIAMLRKRREFTEQRHTMNGATLNLEELASPTALQGGEWGAGSTPVTNQTSNS